MCIGLYTEQIPSQVVNSFMVDPFKLMNAWQCNTPYEHVDAMHY